MKIVITVVCFLIVGISQAQIVIAEGTELATSPDANITITARGNIENNSAFDFSSADLRLSMIGANSVISGNLVANQFSLNILNGSMDLNGNLTVTNQFIFSRGVMRVGEDFKLLYTGNADSVIFEEEEPDSYVDGIFFQRGTGNRIFPIGAGTQPLPFMLTDVKTETEIGVQAFNTTSGISPGLDVKDVDQTRHWVITSDDIAAIQSPVRLYKTGVVFGSQEGSAVAIEADPNDFQAVSLSINDPEEPSYVTSVQVVTRPLIAIGRSEDVTPKIRDLITPYDGSGSQAGNDAIFIENLFPDNTVILMDRWGVKIKEWEDYKNNDPTQYAFFQTLSPGNYICIVECRPTNGKPKRETQMVTILKTN